MKRSFAVLLAVIIALSCFWEMEAFAFGEEHLLGSDDPPSRPESEKVLLAVNEYNENGAIGSATELEYNESRLLARSVHKYYNNGTFSWEYDYLFSYDEAGRLLRRNMYFEEYGTGYDDLIRTYNDKGQLISEETYGDGEESEIREYDYDEDGRLSRERETLSSPMLRGEIKNEYSYSYHTDDQGYLVGVRKDVTGSGEEEIAAVYNPDGLLVEGCRKTAGTGSLVYFKYDYLEIPGTCIRDEHQTFTYESGDGFSSDAKVIYFSDSTGQEAESLIIGAAEPVEEIYDEEGYLVETYNPANYYWKTELIYGSLGAEPEAPSPTPNAEALPPLACENRTEHHEYVTSAGVLTGTSDLAYPYFTDDSQMAELLNESIRTVLDQRRNAELDPQEEEYFSEMVAKGMPPSTDDVEITVTYNADGFLSLLYRYTFYNTGAAHPYTGYEGYIYDTAACGQMGVRDLAGSRYSQMCDRLSQEASKQGVSSGTPDRAEACVLSEDGVSFYFNVGMAVPQEVVTIPFTSEYFDRAPIDDEAADPEGAGSVLTQEEAYALAVAGSGFEDGETQTINGSEYVIEFWDCGRAGYNGRSVYVYQVRQLQKIDGPQMTELMKTVLVDAITGECTVVPPVMPLPLDEDPLSDDSAGGETSNPENVSPTQEAHPILTVTGDGVNIRSGPGTGYGSIGSVNKGDMLFSKGKSDNWYMVEYGNTTGYIIEDYVTIEPGGFYTAVDSGTLSVNGADVNIRSGPGTEYQSIGSVSSGTTLTITGKSDNWYQVNYNGRKGYIIEDYVTKNE